MDEAQFLNNVVVSVYDPNNEENILYTYITTKNALIKINQFKSWFSSVEYYGDYIDIGENLTCVSNLMLFNKDHETKSCYSLTVNCKNNVHLLGTHDPPLIHDVIQYCEKNILPNEDRLKLLNQFISLHE